MHRLSSLFQAVRVPKGSRPRLDRAITSTPTAPRRILPGNMTLRLYLSTSCPETTAKELESRPAEVICLQEVDENWAAKLHQHFQSRLEDEWSFSSFEAKTGTSPLGLLRAGSDML